MLGAFVLIAAGLVASLVDLQTLRAERYVELGESQRIRTRNLAGFRGSLLDRNGFVLAASTPGKELIAEPIRIADPQAAAALLSPLIEEEASVIAAGLTPDTENDRYEFLMRTSDDERIAAIAELLANPDHAETLYGIVLRSEEDRVYPAGSLARPIVGDVDPYQQGSFGFEEQFNDLMQGSPGRVTTERGALGSIAGGLYEVEPAVKGYDIVLTIDHRIQFVVEQALIEHCETMDAAGAQAVVADPRTGDVLAMATVRERQNGSCFVPRTNAPLQDSFEPGSVMKVIAVAAAVEELGYDQNTGIEVPDRIRVGDVEFFEHPGHIGATYPLSDVLVDSLNVGTIQTAKRIGPETLSDYYAAFGFGQYTGIDFNHEARGWVRDDTEWNGSDLGSISIGQGVTANAVQIASAYNAIANGGVYVSPRLVRAAIGPDGAEYDLDPQTSRRVISAETADELTDMLVGVVDRGTGTLATVDGYRVAGKTGTAWKVFENQWGEVGYGGDGNRRYTMSFAGFLPADAPELTVVVSFDEPSVGTSAGQVAAPLFAEIAEYALRILAVPPTDLDRIPSGELVRAIPAPAPFDPNAPVEAPAGDAVVPPVAPEEPVADAPVEELVAEAPADTTEAAAPESAATG